MTVFKSKSNVKIEKAIIILAIVIFVTVFVAVIRKNRLVYLDYYFDTTFYQEKYTVIDHRHISGRDPTDVYLIKLDDLSRTETLDTSNYDDGYTNQARELVRMIDGAILQNVNVKTKVYSNQKLGHKLVIIYNLETRYYAVYFITF